VTRPRRAALAALLSGACALAASASAGAITTVEYRAGITQGADTAHGGALAAIAAGPDGNLWFTEHPGRIGRITPAGVATEFTGFPTGLLAIAAGPDGRMWFTEQPPLAAPRLGWLSVDGATRGSEPVGTDPSSLLLSLVTGPDHVLWLTSFGGTATLGRMTTAGVLTSFTPTYTPPSLPGQITVGPDGALWYAESGEGFGDQRSSTPSYRGIARVTTSGAITAFPLRGRAGRAVFPLDVTTGPDDALWFTAEPTTIGRMTTAGRFTLFTVRLPAGSSIGSIVSSPDSNLWFSVGLGRIGRITRTGAVTIFRTPSHDPAPGDLAVGADGNIWMTDETGGVVKVAPPSGRCVVPQLVGLRYARAKRRLHRAGCTFGHVAAPRRERRATLTVRHQSPQHGARLPGQSSIDVTLR
jgi:virginiamycin B lyase